MYITEHMIEEIRAQAKDELPNEACGYVIGKGDKAWALYRMTNAHHSPTHFSFNPVEQFEALKEAREMGKELIAVYHSHPETPARMSEEDILKAHDTQITYLIYAVMDDEIKGFTIDRQKVVTEVSVKVVAEI